MNQETTQRLEDEFSKYPFLKASGVSVDQIETASKQIGASFPLDLQEFLATYGAAIVGPYPIFGLQCVEAMGNQWSIVQQTLFYRQQMWPDIENWIIISADHSGNPIGITPDGEVWISDYDFGVVTCIADNFEAFILSCLND